jgi:hypothetical protein
MGTRPNRLTSGVLAAVVWGFIELVAPAGATGSVVCSPPPDTLAGLISPDAVETGPLTDQFRPVYGVYPETAAACWAGSEIEVAGFVASPEGLGGVTSFSIEPAWMVSRAHFLSTTDSVDPQAGPVGPFLPVAVPPALEAEFTELGRRWVRVSGHFNDRAAKACVVAAPSPDLGAVPTAEQAIEICRTSFVLTVVEPLAAPPTDAESLRPAVGTPTWVGLLLALGGGACFGLVLRRRSGSGGKGSRGRGR